MNYSMSPPQASNFAAPHDWVFYILLALTIVFTLIVGVAVVIFAARYRAGTKVNRARPVHEHMTLELTWTIIPLILGLFMFVAGAKLFVYMRTPPKDAMNIFVVGKQWMWHAQHENGIRENNTIHVPVGKPVRLTMISQDVIHAMYIPAFRVQYHVVPGRYTQLWFTATKVGTYHMFCAMYCGNQHSEMGGYVYVMEPGEYAKWVAAGGEDVPRLTMAQEGARQWNKLGCGNGNCHNEADTARGPSLFGLLGKTRTFADGSSAKADEAYIRESILQPYNHITKGYDNTMPAYEGQLSEEDVLALIAYIRSLGGAGTPQTNINAQKGTEPSGGYERPNRNMSVGAVEGQLPSRPGPRTGNLSVGAQSMQGQANHE